MGRVSTVHDKTNNIYFTGLPLHNYILVGEGEAEFGHSSLAVRTIFLVVNLISICSGCCPPGLEELSLDTLVIDVGGERP